MYLRRAHLDHVSKWKPVSPEIKSISVSFTEYLVGVCIGVYHRGVCILKGSNYQISSMLSNLCLPFCCLGFPECSSGKRATFCGGADQVWQSGPFLPQRFGVFSQYMQQIERVIYKPSSLPYAGSTSNRIQLGFPPL